MDPPPEDDQRLKRKRPREPEDDDPGAIPGSSRVADDQERQDRSSGSMDDPVSECKHRIFLSHSGHDKDFVEDLCGDLERWYRFPFFDKRSSSLPKGEPFPESILDAAGSCELGVVVVSDKYFMSKWPMIELDAFVQTWLMQKEHNMETKLKILPLFYGLSVVEFKEEERRARWFSKWEDLAKEDPRIDIDRWKRSLGALASFNGIAYHGGSGKKAYRDEIVEQICNEVPPDVEWDNSHVQEGSKICQVIEDAIARIQPSRQYGVRVVGVYGVGGMGKTTLCGSLGNRLSQKNHMKASHVELGSKSYGELLRKVLKDCTNISEVFVQGLDEGKYRNILLKEACKQKMFLAIDNVWPNSKSLEEAGKFLQLGFHKESIVLVTSRALETLTSLGISKCDCFEMPCLDDEDAKNLFLFHVAYHEKISDENDKRAIESCVDLCYFSKGKSNDRQYLPLALKALGIQLGHIGSCPSEWVKALPRVRDFNYLQEEENPVFSILRSSFDCLRPIQQSLLLDLVVFAPSLIYNPIGLIEWLALVYNQSLHEIKIMVSQLKKRGLVEAIDMAAGKVYIHDLYREFAILEAKGRLKDSPFEERKWVYCDESFPTELLEECGRWKNLTRFKISPFIHHHLYHEFNWIERVKWANCSNIVVLELKHLRASMDLKGLRCLKSLFLEGVYQLEGLQDLTALNYFRWTCYHDYDNHSRLYIEKFPPSLRILILEVQVSLSTEAFDMCVNLARLRLMNCLIGNLDFKNCSSLQNVDISGLVPDLKVVSELSLCGLQDLTNLTHFGWTADGWREVWYESHFCRASNDEFHGRIQCQLPVSIEVLYICGVVFLRSDVFARCTKLSKLTLHSCRAENLDLRNCISLQSIRFNELQRLEQPSSIVPDVSLINLQELRNLTHLSLKPYRNEDKLVYKLDWLPTSLRVLEIGGNVLLTSSLFHQCGNLTELKLWNIHVQNLNFGKYSTLDSLELHDPHSSSLERMPDWSLWDLQEMSNFTSFHWSGVNNHDEFYYKMGQLPMVSLEVLEIRTKVMLRPDVVARCTKLTQLVLENCHAEILDFSYCTSLQHVELRKVERLQTISGLSAASTSFEIVMFEWFDKVGQD